MTTQEPRPGLPFRGLGIRSIVVCALLATATVAVMPVAGQAPPTAFLVPAGVTAIVTSDLCVNVDQVDIDGTLLAVPDSSGEAPDIFLHGNDWIRVSGSIIGANGGDGPASAGNVGNDGKHGSSIILQSPMEISLFSGSEMRSGSGGNGGHTSPSSPSSGSTISGGNGGSAGWLILDGPVLNMPTITAPALGLGGLYGNTGGHGGGVSVPAGTAMSTLKIVGGNGGPGGGLLVSDPLSAFKASQRVLALSPMSLTAAVLSTFAGCATGQIDVPVEGSQDGPCTGGDGEDAVATGASYAGGPATSGTPGTSAGPIGFDGKTGANGAGVGEKGGEAVGGNGDDGCMGGNGGDGGNAVADGGAGQQGGQGGQGGSGTHLSGNGGTGGAGGPAGQGGNAKGGKPGCGGAWGTNGAPGTASANGGVSPGGEGGQAGNGPGGRAGEAGPANRGAAGTATVQPTCVN